MARVASSFYVTLFLLYIPSFVSVSISQCELNALRLGTELADVFNSPVGNEDWEERVNQDFIAEHLGFAPWLVNGVRKSGLTMTKNSSKTLQEKGGWVGKPIADSPYGILDRKWVYMFGDSTTRQVWASFAAPFQGKFSLGHSPP